MSVQRLRLPFPIVDEAGRPTQDFLRFLRNTGAFADSTEEQAIDAAAKALEALAAAEAAQTEVDALEAVVAALGLNDLVDVDTTTTTPSDGDVLTWVNTNGLWEPAPVSGAATAVWGGITGTLSDQSDLQSALDGKASISHTHVTSDITNLSSYTGFDTRYYTETEVDGLISVFLADAPSDGNEYVRKDGAWAVASSGAGILPLVDGSVPPNLVYEEDGSLVYVEI